MKSLIRVLVALLLPILFFFVLPIIPTSAAETDVIRIGYTAPFSGPAAEFGNNGWMGISLALEEINKKGISINGKFHKIRIFKYDSECTPDKGVSNVHKMVTEDNVIAILGDHCSTVASSIGFPDLRLNALWTTSLIRVMNSIFACGPPLK